MYYFNLTLTTLREALSLLIALLRRGNCGQRRQLFHGNIFQGIGQNCKLGETRRCYSWLKLERIRESLWTPRREAESWVWAPDSTDIQEEGTSYHWLPCLSVSIGDTGGWTLQITARLSEGDGSSRHSEEPLSPLKPSLQNSCDFLHVFHERPQCKNILGRATFSWQPWQVEKLPRKGSCSGQWVLDLTQALICYAQGMNQLQSPRIELLAFPILEACEWGLVCFSYPGP